MDQADAWRPDCSLEDALRNLSNDCTELARCLEAGDEEFAGMVASELARLKAPVQIKLKEVGKEEIEATFSSHGAATLVAEQTTSSTQPSAAAQEANSQAGPTMGTPLSPGTSAEADGSCSGVHADQKASTADASPTASAASPPKASTADASPAANAASLPSAEASPTANTSLSSSRDMLGAGASITPQKDAVAAAAAVLKAAGRPTNVAIASKSQVHVVGSRVEYYSQSAGGWIPAVVQGYDEKRGTYRLDVQPIALPQKVRSVGTTASQTPVSSLTLGGEKSPADSDSRPSGYLPGGPNSGSGNHGERFAVGESVEYYSSSHGKWVPAVVQGFNESIGAYKLDIQSVALASKVRRAPADVT